MGSLSKFGKIFSNAALGFVAGGPVGAAVGGFKGYSDSRNEEVAERAAKRYQDQVRKQAAAARRLEQLQVKPNVATQPAPAAIAGAGSGVSLTTLALAGIAVFAVIRRR